MEKNNPVHSTALSIRTVKTLPKVGDIFSSQVYHPFISNRGASIMKPKFLTILLAVSLLIAACGSGNKSTSATPEVIPTVIADDTIIAEGRVEPVHFAQIAFSTSGVVSDVLIKEGQQVQKGQPLIQLGDASDTNYAAAQVELANAQMALNDLVDTSGSDLAQTVIELKDAKEAYNKADNYLHYLQTAQKVPQTQTQVYLVQTWKGYQYEYKTKNFKGPAPEDWIIEAQNDLALKKAKMDELQRAYDRMKNGADSEQLALLEARLNAAKAGVAAFSVVAPFDGVVAALSAKTGSSINAGEVAVTVADFSNWLVKTTDVTEIDVVNLKEGQPVTVTFDALPELELKGSVLSIGQTYTQNQGDIVYEVTVLLTDTNPALRWGMTSAVKFEK
jgi:multidrug resistance efflux pump